MAVNERGDGRTTDSPVDIVHFVEEVHRFSALVEPFEQVWTAVSDVRRWSSPNTTLTVLLIFNIAGLILTKGAVFVLVSLLIFFLSGVSLFHVHTRVLDKVLPQTNEEADIDPVSDGDSSADTMQSVREFRTSLIQMYVILEQFNQGLVDFYSILKWDDMPRSLKYHIGMCFSMLCLCVLPTSWNFLIFSNWFLLSDDKVYQYLWSHGLEKLKILIEEKSGVELLLQNGPVTSHNIKKPSAEKVPVDGGDGKIPLTDLVENEDVLDGEGDMGSSESDNESDTKTTRSKPSVISRINELRKRKQMITGQCHSCQASFSSILKRRYCCMHCGNYFCARCCSQKVPRSVFGATAPAAQTETVPVCGSCFTLLSSKEGKSN